VKPLASAGQGGPALGPLLPFVVLGLRTSVAWRGRRWFRGEPKCCISKGACGQAVARLLERREAPGLRPRAQRASLTDSSPLFERRERSERSEFGDVAARPSIGGKSPQSGDRSSEAPQPARKRLCRSRRRMNATRRTTTMGRDRTSLLDPCFRHHRHLPRGKATDLFALFHLVVLDLSHILAGPWPGQMLTDVVVEGVNVGGLEGCGLDDASRGIVQHERSGTRCPQ
jgi:hypothetical protein